MINPKCPVCLGLGWVCENHPDRAWDTDIGCECGAGVPCECQRANGLEQLTSVKFFRRSVDVATRNVLQGNFKLGTGTICTAVF